MSLANSFNPACDWCQDGQNPFEYPVTMHEIGGVETMVTVAKAEAPIATIHFLKGFKSHPVFYKKFLEDMTQAGINVVLVTLPDPGQQINYMDDYESLAQAVFVDGEVDHLIDSTVPKIAASHSTGGFLTMKLLTEDDKAKAISERYESTFSAAPFFGNKYHRLKLFGALARLYSSLQSHVPVGTTWLERQFSDAAGKHPKDIKMLANHRQALYMDTPTKDLMKHIRDHGFSKYADKINHTFMLGNTDLVSYNTLAQEVALELGAHVYTVDGGHSLVRKKPEGRDLVKNHVTSIANQNFSGIQRPLPKPSNQNDLPKEPEIYTPAALDIA